MKKFIKITMIAISMVGVNLQANTAEKSPRINGKNIKKSNAFERMFQKVAKKSGSKIIAKKYIGRVKAENLLYLTQLAVPAATVGIAGVAVGVVGFIVFGLFAGV